MPSAIYDAYLKIVEQADPKAKAEMLAGHRPNGVAIRAETPRRHPATAGRYGLHFQFGERRRTDGRNRRHRAQRRAKSESHRTKNCSRSCKRLRKANPSAPTIQKSDLNGKEIYSLQMPGAARCLAPTWCLTDKELIVGMTPEKVKAYLSRQPISSRWPIRRRLRKSFEGGSGPLALVYFDSKQMFDGLYAALPMLLVMASPTLQQQGINFNASMLPSPNSIRPHLLPLVATVRKTSSGIEIYRAIPPCRCRSSCRPPIPWPSPCSCRRCKSAREAARRAQSMNNLKQIGLAMHNYHDARRPFPPAFKADKDGKPLLSWRVLILPYLEEDELYQQFHLDEPWDSEHNKKLIDKMPDVYKSPNSSLAGEGKTNYLTVRGEKTIFSGGKGARIADIADGTSNTIMVVEAADEKAVPWTKPDDFEYDENNPLKGLAACTRRFSRRIRRRLGASDFQFDRRRRAAGIFYPQRWRARATISDFNDPH